MKLFIVVIVSLAFLGCMPKQKKHEYRIPQECNNSFLLSTYDGKSYWLNFLEFNQKMKKIVSLGVYEIDGLNSFLYNCNYQKIVLTYDYRNAKLGNAGYEILNIDGSNEEFYNKEGPSPLFSYDQGVLVGTRLIQKAEYNTSLGDTANRYPSGEVFSYTHYIAWSDIFETKTFAPRRSYRMRFGEDIAIVKDAMYGGALVHNTAAKAFRVDLKTGRRKILGNIMIGTFAIFLPSKPEHYYLFNPEQIIDKHHHTSEEIALARAQLSSEEQQGLALADSLKPNAIYEASTKKEDVPKLLFEANATVYDFFLKGDDIYLLTDNNIIKYSPLTKTKKVFRYPFKKRPNISTFLGENFIFTFDGDINSTVGVVVTNNLFEPISKPFRTKKGNDAGKLSTQNNQAQAQLYNENFGNLR